MHGLSLHRRTAILQLKLLLRSGSKKEKPWSNLRWIWSENLWLLNTPSLLCCSTCAHFLITFVFMAGRRRKTSSTLSLAASSALTTIPPTSRADSRALLTSTWPLSVACSTMTSSTPFFLDVPLCSTRPPSGLKKILLGLGSPLLLL